MIQSARVEERHSGDNPYAELLETYEQSYESVKNHKKELIDAYYSKSIDRREFFVYRDHKSITALIRCLQEEEDDLLQVIGELKKRSLKFDNME